uniref:Protease Do-like PDZ domain-containing protein n=2 Tax=Palpitomonas bilix TaxID=652834 RepID=A0A7S3LW79_9EUKA|mmetsp:Transcript_5499/g.12582  ORF Transcript_5499/g.12582 Transcript_5499/m.12582 type:complete len:594 (+) Transcript_5499:47-1828(+)
MAPKKRSRVGEDKVEQVKVQATNPTGAGRRRGSFTRSPSFDSKNVVSPLSAAQFPPESFEEMMEEAEDSLADTLGAIVKVIAKHTEPNFSLPWQMRHQASSSSTGFCIEGKKILTNAHSVEYHSLVKVKKRGDDRKYVATVLAIGRECDIAMLMVEDDAFWEGVVPLTFGDLPHLQESVTVVGYPIGGDNISITQGVVSRIDLQQYAHGSIELLAVQIDAAINSGNSGGPAISSDRECIGIAFQSLKGDAENIGYIIPTPIIQHFLEDFEKNKKYTGFCDLGVFIQQLENPQMKAALKMEKSDKGVLVLKVMKTSPAAKVLRRFDVLTHFNGHPIASDGSVDFRNGERIFFSYLFHTMFAGEEAQVSFIRNGEKQSATVTLKPREPLVPSHIEERAPSYFIFAGLVFTVLTEPYMKAEYGDNFDYESPVQFLRKWLTSSREELNEEVVVLSQVLAHEVNVGFEVNNIVLRKVNGVKVKNLRSVVELALAITEAPKVTDEKTPDFCPAIDDNMVKFEFEDDEVMILGREEALAATATILSQHNIPSALSSDMSDLSSSLDDHSTVEQKPRAATASRQKGSGGKKNQKRKRQEKK